MLSVDRSMRFMGLAVLLLPACTQEPASTAENQAAATSPIANTAAPAESAPLGNEEAADDDAGIAGAVAVTERYFTLIEEKRYRDAFRLWSADPGATSLSDGAFAGSFDPYATYRGTIGEPGRIEGAAGSLYVEIPVVVTGTLKDGGPFRLEGPVTLRRSNDVPGATAEQREWRIYRIDLD